METVREHSFVDPRSISVTVRQAGSREDPVEYPDILVTDESGAVVERGRGTADGTYTSRQLASGYYSITVRRLGYYPYTSLLLVDKSSCTLVVGFWLTNSFKPLAERSPSRFRIEGCETKR